MSSNHTVSRKSRNPEVAAHQPRVCEALEQRRMMSTTTFIIYNGHAGVSDVGSDPALENVIVSSLRNGVVTKSAPMAWPDDWEMPW